MLSLPALTPADVEKLHPEGGAKKDERTQSTRKGRQMQDAGSASASGFIPKPDKRKHVDANTEVCAPLLWSEFATGEFPV